MPNHVNQPELLLIGSGKMAMEYAKVLQAQHISFKTIGRSTSSAQIFRQETGCPVQSGGLGLYLQRQASTTLTAEKDALPSTAIVAVSVEQLAPTTLLLLKHGVKHILVEKPGGLHFKEIEKVAHTAVQHKANVYLAYNRRFYASTLRAQEMITRDGGVQSFTFDFTERSDLVASSNNHPEVKKQWFLANSSHVVDLAFYLGGEPLTMDSYTAGGLCWHPSASIFGGSGQTKGGALFSYHANWEAPGRWGVELRTARHRFILEPLEQLSIQKNGSFATKQIALHDSLDRMYKPGLYQQVKAFINSHNVHGESHDSLLSIEEHHHRNVPLFKAMTSGHSQFLKRKC